MRHPVGAKWGSWQVQQRMAPLMLCPYNNLTKTGYFWRQIQIVRKSQFKFSVKLKSVSSGKTFQWPSWCHVTREGPWKDFSHHA